MWRALWQYNRWYAAHKLYDSWFQRLDSLARLFTPELWLLWPLIVLSAHVVLRRHRAYTLLAASVWLMIWLGGHYRYQQIVWMPVLCLGAGLAVQHLHHRSIPSALSALALLLLHEGPQYRVPLDQFSAEIHKTDNYVESRKLAATLHEPFYVWGQSPEIYFDSGQQPVTGLVWYYPLIQGPLTNELTQQTLRELQANPPPTVIIDPWRVVECESHPIWQWIDHHYTAVSNYWMFIVCQRKTGSGVALQRVGGLQEAIEQRQQALGIKPNLAETQYNLGNALQRLGWLQEAIGHYEQALRLKPDFAEAHCSLAVALGKEGRLQEAIVQFEQALQFMPDSVEAHYGLGGALLQAGRLPEAIQQCEQALRLKADSADAHYNLAVGLHRTGRLQEAIGHYEQAVRFKPDFAEAHNNLAVALEQAGRVQDAIEHWERALQLIPDSAEAHYNLGVALEKLGRTQDAIQHYEQALRIKPDFTQAQNALARLQAGQ